MDRLSLAEIDAFDLPDWLGAAQVTWRADEGLRSGAHVRGRLAAKGCEDLPCDLLAVDEAFPAPLTDDRSRVRAHQAWRHGQVLVATHGGRLVLAVPGTSFTPETAIDAVSRLAKAVGADPDRYCVLLRLGTDTNR